MVRAGNSIPNVQRGYSERKPEAIGGGMQVGPR